MFNLLNDANNTNITRSLPVAGRWYSGTEQTAER
jgi:hypothetical protein